MTELLSITALTMALSAELPNINLAITNQVIGPPATPPAPPATPPLVPLLGPPLASPGLPPYDLPSAEIVSYDIVTEDPSNLTAVIIVGGVASFLVLVSLYLGYRFRCSLKAALGRTEGKEPQEEDVAPRRPVSPLAWGAPDEDAAAPPGAAAPAPAGSRLMGTRMGAGARIMPNIRRSPPESAAASGAPESAAGTSIDEVEEIAQPPPSQEGGSVLSNLMRSVPEYEEDLTDVSEEQLFSDRMEAWERLAQAEREQRFGSELAAAGRVPPRRPSRTPSSPQSKPGEFTAVAFSM
jgi:hypothetical protein